MPWPTLESIPGLLATETDWQRMIGPTFGAFKALCLEPSAFQVQSVRCPRHCGCNHQVVRRHDGAGAVGVCRCPGRACPDIPLTQADITALEVSEPRLGGALCKAFGFSPRHAALPAPKTFQFGSWSAEAIPAILTIQVQRAGFRRAVAELAAQLRRPFLLFAPTADFLDAPALGILENHGAGFFALDTHVVLTERGTLQSARPPGELFARFTPQPKETELDIAARVFALVRKLDTDKPLPPPSLLSVFRRYCVEELSATQAAARLHCSKPTIIRRLKLIRSRTGLHPAELRRLSPHIARLEDSMRDGRARRIRPGSLMEGEAED